MDQNNTLEVSPIEIVLPSNTLGNRQKDNFRPFLAANTIESSLEEIKQHHIIPVFTKDNETLISHSEFIESVMEVTGKVFSEEQILLPQVRLSHPVKGRIPEAKDKPASMLLDSEKTLYYERMMFQIEVPSIHDSIDGNILSLSI